LQKYADIHAVAVGDYTPSCRSVASNAPTCHPSNRGELSHNEELANRSKLLYRGAKTPYFPLKNHTKHAKNANFA